MILAGSSSGISAPEWFGMGASLIVIVSGIAAALGPGRKMTRALAAVASLAADLQQMATDYKEIPPRLEHREGREIVVDPGRPGIPGQIAEFRGEIVHLREALKTTADQLDRLAHIPDQLIADKAEMHARLDRNVALLERALKAAGEAAIMASRSDQRMSELAELVGEQVERVHLENEAMRATLHEIGIDTDLTRPPEE